MPALRERYAGPFLVLTCDSINPVDFVRCDGCSEWCQPKPLRIGTLEKGRSEQVVESSAGQLATGWLAGRRVLVCDDNAVNRALAVTLLEQYGAQVVEARDGLEAIAGTTHDIDLVLMDLQMPGMSGTEAAQRIRAALGADCPPMIALTASAMEGVRQRSLEAGLDDHLTKPLDEARLIGVLKRWLPDSQSPDVTTDKSSHGAAEQPGEVRIHDVDAALAIAGGRPGLVRKMLQMFLDEAPQQRADLAAGWRENDPERLRAALHKLCGSAEYCALTQLAHAIGAAEERLARDGTRSLERHLESVRIELDRAVAEARRQVDAQR
jgi:CheY-like chemotaxis protein/HPt (histidine-containing phosphotransfer) domain-containing protein